MGNRLFPWARAYLFAKDHGARIIWPNWQHFRRGPLLRGGVKWRYYPGKIYLFGNFTPNQNYVRGLHKQILLKSGRLFSEVDSLHLGECNSIPSQILIFEGDRNQFLDFEGRCAELREALVSIASPRVISELQVRLPPIALNIRRGKDFRDPISPHDFETTGGLRTPLEWFICSLQRIRKLLGGEIGAYIVSDGNEIDLKPVLDLPNTVHVKSTTALGDLLLLSRARLLIASGGSSFSAWGAFLSEGSAISIPGQNLTWFGLSAARVGVFDPHQSSDAELLRYCASVSS